MGEFFNKIGELFSTPAYIDSLLHGFLLTLQILQFERELLLTFLPPLFHFFEDVYILPSLYY